MMGKGAGAGVARARYQRHSKLAYSLSLYSALAQTESITQNQSH
jgi:hypothetical protein